MRILTWGLGVAILLGVLSASLASPAHARTLELERFDAKIVVEPSGRVVVEEKIRVRFRGQWNGIFRWIPYGYTYPNGLRNKIVLRLDAVENEFKQPLEHWVSRSSGRLGVKIRVPGANDAVQTVVIRYHALDVIRLQNDRDEDYGAYDELYWNVTGNDWAAPIHAATAEVHLPEGVESDRIQTGAFTGEYGAQGSGWTVEALRPGVVRYSTTEMLHPGAGFTIAVTFPPGHVDHPTVGQRIWWFVQANGFALLPLLVLLAWLWMWRAFGRDALGGRTIIPDWKSPDHLRPAEVGILADDRLDPRDLTATLVDLAVRGVVTIEEVDDDWRLTLHPERKDKASLTKYEGKVVRALFDGDETSVHMKTLKHKFYKNLKSIQDSVLDRLVGKGYFQKRPDKVVERWSGMAFLAMVVLVALGFVLDTTWLYWVVCIPSVIGLFVVSRWMPRRTHKGLDTLARIRGLEEYIVTAEADRLKALPMEHFDEVLPYAVALGLHERWADAFDGLYDREPDWYRGKQGRVSPWMITHGLSGMDKRVSQNLLAAPRSKSSGTGGRSWGGGWSGGSGFSGGSSGGGFGGGGGGGW